jgi:hypothetical protein
MNDAAPAAPTTVTLTPPIVSPAPDAGQPAASGAPKWIPTILLHVLYPDSRKVGFGWVLFILSSYAAFFGHASDGKPLLDAQTWLICTAFTAGLIGAGTIIDAKHDLEMAKVAAGSNVPTP